MISGMEQEQWETREGAGTVLFPNEKNKEKKNIAIYKYPEDWNKVQEKPNSSQLKPQEQANN